MRFWPLLLTLALLISGGAWWWWRSPPSPPAAEPPPHALLLALQAQASGDHETALAHAETIDLKGPNGKEALDIRLDALRRLRRYEEGLKLLDQHGDDADAGTHLHRYYYCRALFLHGAALQSADRLVALNPLSALAHQRRCDTLLDLKEYGQARDAAEVAERLAPKTSLPHTGTITRADVALRMDRFDEAIVLLNGVIEQAPELEEAHLSRAHALRGKGNLEGAIKAISRAIELSADEPYYYVVRAGLFHRHKQAARAIEDCTRAIRLDPHSAEALAARGYSRWKREEYAAALADFNDAIRVSPSSPEGHKGLAWMLATCPNAAWRDGQRAVGHATRACELSRKTSEEALAVLAAAYAETGKFDLAALHQAEAVVDKFAFFPDDLKEMGERHEAYKAGKPWRDTK